MGENATKLRQLVDQALDLSMLNSDRRPLKREPGDLVALLRETQASWQAVAQSRTIRLACGELPPVYMDVGAIHDVMDHLLRNALRHTPERSEVLVEVATQDGMAEVSVRDQGPGLSEEQLARLFQPFVHLQTPDAPGSQGSGLGLAFCRQLIERHRGTIRAESSERLGTRVIFTLPIASVRFLLEEAFRCAQEEAAREHSQFGLLLVTPARSGEGTQPIEAVVRRAEQILRRNTHRGDRFVRVDSSAFAIVAVTDGPGLQAMAMRLRHVLDQAQLSVTIGRACFPADGGTVDRLVEVARRGGLASAAVRATTRNSKEVAT
jgi:anti-sigma regulatory factor (Ser/Thr protein kinase)